VKKETILSPKRQGWIASSHHHHSSTRQPLWHVYGEQALTSLWKVLGEYDVNSGCRAAAIKNACVLFRPFTNCEVKIFCDINSEPAG
jgi:hypothetical protein